MPSELYVDNVNFNSINNSQISGFRNLIINGRFTINQRGAASKIASSNAYNYDRWYYKSDGKLYQGIENLNLNASDSLTISWSSSTATAEYLFSNDSTANNGWDGSGAFTSVTNGGTFTVPSGLTTEHLWIRFTDASDTDFSELTKVQVEYGTKATMYEHRPYGLELSLCQRYFYREQSGVFLWSTYQSGQGAFERVNASGMFPIVMRASPTLTFSGDQGYFVPVMSSVTPTGDVGSAAPSSGSPLAVVTASSGISRAQAERGSLERGVHYRNTCFNGGTLNCDAEL